MFENLTNKFEEIFSSLKKAPSLDENQVDEGLKSIRLALLEADVSLEVVKEFISKVKPKALGQEIVRSTSPGQMVVKIVYDELISFFRRQNFRNSIKCSATSSNYACRTSRIWKNNDNCKVSKIFRKK